MTSLFIALQFILFLLMIFHDWISVPPLNDIPALKREDTTFYRLLGSIVNGVLVLIPLTLTLVYVNTPVLPFWAGMSISLFYLLLTIGSTLSWWVPYFFGSSPQHKQAFAKFKNTHHFLPAIGNNVVPNTLHVILHLCIWACLGLSLVKPIAFPSF